MAEAMPLAPFARAIALEPPSGPAEPRRIVHVLAPSAAGGLETVVRVLAAAQRRWGHEVTVAALTDHTPAPLSAALLADGVAVHEIALPPRSYRAERRAIAEVLRKVRPSVMHSHGYRPDVLALRVARNAGIAAVSTVHGFTGGDWRNRIYELAQRVALRRFDAVVAVSRPLVHQLVAAGCDGPRVHLVTNALLTDSEPLSRELARRALRLPNAGFRIGWVGRLAWEKGPDVMVRAIGALGDDRPPLSFVGDGSARGALGRAARLLGVEDHITWHGLVPDASRYLRAFDVVVLSSRTEGTPIAALEAMRAGVPLVVTKVGGVPDLLPENCALLVPSESPEAIAAAVRVVRDDPVAARRRAETARERAAEWCHPERWLAAYDAVYSAALRTLGGRT